MVHSIHHSGSLGFKNLKVCLRHRSLLVRDKLRALQERTAQSWGGGPCLTIKE